MNENAKAESQPLSANAPPSLRVRKILAPVDFSDCSRKALRYATALARQFGASVEVLFVLETTIPAPELAAVNLELVRNELLVGAEREMADLQKSLPQDIAVKTTIREGNPRVEIVDAARETEADLIVLSTHGRTGLAHVFMGSTAERVVRHAPCPALVVREREHEFLEESPSGSA